MPRISIYLDDFSFNLFLFLNLNNVAHRLVYIYFCRPDLVDMSRVSAQTNRSNLEQAFSVAEQLGVARLLDPEGRIHTRVWF